MEIMVLRVLNYLNGLKGKVNKGLKVFKGLLV